MKKFKILRESDSCCRREGEYYNSKLNPRDRHVAEGIAVTDYTNDKLRVGNDEFVYFYVCKDDGSFCDASGKPFKSDDDARKYVACLCDYDASEVAHELNKILGNVYQWDMFRRPNKITENKNYNTMKRYIIKKRQSVNESKSMRSRMRLMEDTSMQGASAIFNNFKGSGRSEDEEKEMVRRRYSRIHGIKNYWKNDAIEFLSDKNFTKGPIRRDMTRLNGQFGKCVIYIDTSGSVNNGQSRLSIVIAELLDAICKCGYESVDVNSFNNRVYRKKTYYCDDMDFDVSDLICINGGGDIACVYEDIEDEYIDGNGNLRDDVTNIIIITDESGMVFSDSDIDYYYRRFSRNTKEHMLYIVYDDRFGYGFKSRRALDVMK